MRDNLGLPPTIHAPNEYDYITVERILKNIDQTIRSMLAVGPVRVSEILFDALNDTVVTRSAAGTLALNDVPFVTSTGPQLRSYTVAGAPAATTAGKLIYVSNESGGAVVAFSDGTNWRRVTDRAIIS